MIGRTVAGVIFAMPFMAYATSTENHGTGAWKSLYEAHGAEGQALAFLIFFVSLANFIGLLRDYLDG